jgi:hypothetical protein
MLLPSGWKGFYIFPIKLAVEEKNYVGSYVQRVKEMLKPLP